MEKGLLHWPIDPRHINQKFGENNACVSLDGQNRVITCDGNNPPPGFKSLYGSSGHLGLDLRAYHGQEVYCAQEGIVYNIDTNPKSGLDVKILSTVGGRQLMHIYEHLLGYQVKVGDKVKTGQLIGWADNTGYSSGDHLHFEVKERIGDGPYVSIDPLPIMSDMFAKDVLKLNDSIKYLSEQIALLADRLADWIRNRNIKNN